MEYISVKSRVLTTLRGRKRAMTALDLTQKLGDTTPQTIYATISQLRKEGHKIISSPNKDGINRYSLA